MGASASSTSGVPTAPPSTRGVVAPTPAPAPPPDDLLSPSRDEARSERLRSMNSVKNRIWNEWQKQCLKKCDDEVRDYWICREEQGLLAPLRCLEENEAMKRALQDCGRDDVAYAAYRSKRLDEVEDEILGRLERAAGKEAMEKAKAAGGAGVGALR